jgi:hypothetical protein
VVSQNYAMTTSHTYETVAVPSLMSDVELYALPLESTISHTSAFFEPMVAPLVSVASVFVNLTVPKLGSVSESFSTIHSTFSWHSGFAVFVTDCEIDLPEVTLVIFAVPVVLDVAVTTTVTVSPAWNESVPG